jgi:Na+/proline symporter
MSRASSVRVASLASAAALVAPSVAHASGGWDGLPTLLGLLAVPVLLIVGVVLAVLLALKKGMRVGAIVGLIAGVLGAGWQIFWYLLDIGSENSTRGVVVVGLGINAAVFVLAALLFRGAPSSAPPAAR